MGITEAEMKIVKAISVILAAAFGAIIGSSTAAVLANDFPMVILLGIFAGVTLWLCAGCVTIIAKGVDKSKEER